MPPLNDRCLGQSAMATSPRSLDCVTHRAYGWPVRGWDRGPLMRQVGMITRLGNAPGVRRLVRRREIPGEVRENSDEDVAEPTWCADCRRELLFNISRCPDCGGMARTAQEMARQKGDLPVAGPSACGLALPTRTTGFPQSRPMMSNCGLRLPEASLPQRAGFASCSPATARFVQAVACSLLAKGPDHQEANLTLARCWYRLPEW